MGSQSLKKILVQPLIRQPKTIRDVILGAGRSLQSLEDSSPNPWREARLLLAHVLGEQYETVLVNQERALSADQEKRFEEFVQRRLECEPISKIIGRREFWGLDFSVTRDTLDPRSDSETIVESVLKEFPSKENPLALLDLGVGTGCLLLSLLKEYPHAFGIGVDKSETALLVALKNAQDLGVLNRCGFLRGHWGDSLDGTFDVIVSNPPYIARDEVLPPEVALFDPPEALYADESGYGCYRELANGLRPLLKPKGRIFLEIGFGQAQSVVQIFENQGFFLLQMQPDLSGIPRSLVFGS